MPSMAACGLSVSSCDWERICEGFLDKGFCLDSPHLGVRRYAASMATGGPLLFYLEVFFIRNHANGIFLRPHQISPFWLG